jgi:hypothetical protein
MIGRRELPENYQVWNRRWGAPAGLEAAAEIPHPRRRLNDPDPARFGPFAFQFQVAAETRTFEYPWAYYAAGIEPGMRVLDVGAGLSGLQFVLAKEGCEVVNIDPSAKEDPGGWRRATSWWLTTDNHQEVNQVFGTDVRLVPRKVQDSGLASGSFDRVLCLSVLEHIDAVEAHAMLESMADLLVPGGLCMLTVDLFLDLKPFGILDRNYWGTNLDLHRLLQGQRLERIEGNPSELFGFPEFDYDGFVSHVDEYLMGVYPCVTQTLVLRKV